MIFGKDDDPKIWRKMMNLFFGSEYVSSANGEVLVWGPVVWIPRIPLWKGLGFLGVPLESRTTGTQTNN